MRRAALVLFASLASSIAISAAAAPATQSVADKTRGTKRAGAPPPVVNVVHHKLKRGSPANYQALEANIVSAYERARIPRFFWLTFQSTKDARVALQ